MPEFYIGTQPASLVMQQAALAQQQANQQADINSRNYAADRDFWKSINQNLSDQNLAFQRSGYDQTLANLNNAAAMQQLQQKLGMDQQLAQLQSDTSRYGMDTQRDTALAGFQNQLGIAGLQNQGANYRAGLEAQTASLSPMLKQERFNTVLPLFQGLLQGFSSGFGGGMGGGFGGEQNNSVGTGPAQQPSQPVGGGLPPWAPPPGQANSFWTDLYLQQKAGGYPNPVYGGGGQVSGTAGYAQPMGMGPNGESMTVPQMQQASASYQPPVQQIPASQVQKAGGGGGGSSQSSGSGGGGGGGSSSSSTSFGGGAPQIGLNPPSSPQQWDQQINRQIGMNNKNMSTENNQLAQSYGSRYGTFGRRGIGQVNRNNARLAGLNQDARIQIPMQGQKEFSDYMLGAQTAQANQWNNQQQLGLQNKQIQSSMFAPLLSALTGLAG